LGEFELGFHSLPKRPQVFLIAKGVTICSWYPEILNVFYQGAKKNSWSTIPQQKLPDFFSLIGFIMADFVRGIIERSIKNYVNMFLSIELPQFIVKLTHENNEIMMDPQLREIKILIENLVDTIINSLDKIHRIETQLFGTKGVKFVSVNFEATFPTFVAKQKSNLSAALVTYLRSTSEYISVFSPHSDLISGKMESDIEKFLESETKFDALIDEAKRLRELASSGILSAFPYSVYFPLVHLSCEELINSLSQRALSLVFLIMEKVASDSRSEHARLAQEFSTLSDRLSKQPNNVEEMAALQKSLDKAKTEESSQLQVQVEECRTRLNALIQYYDMRKEDYDLNTSLFTWPQKMGPTFSLSEDLIRESRKNNEDELKSRREKLFAELETLSRQVSDFAQYGDVDEIQKYLKSAQKFQVKLDNLSDRINSFNRDEKLFGWQTTVFPLLEQTVVLFTPYMTLYQSAVDFQKACNQWINGTLIHLEAEKVENETTNLWRGVYKILNVFEHHEPAAMAQKVKEELEQFKAHIPMIRVLCNPGLRDRHWQAISNVVGFKLFPDETVTLGSILEKNLGYFMEQLENISTTATKEHSFEKTLQKMYSEWESMEFHAVDYRDTGTQILSAIDDIQMLLDDHIVKTQAMRGSPYIKPFEEETKTWDSKLNMIQEILDVWLKVQMTWLYLEPIFSSEDIMRQMPTEGKRFREVDAFWKELMKYLAQDYHVLISTAMPDLFPKLTNCNEELELIQKGLNHYLEVKRLYFPRFFFLSNDEMLEILSGTALTFL
jgi:dynein heavy chain